jgi:hypothetical protein
MRQVPESGLSFAITMTIRYGKPGAAPRRPKLANQPATAPNLAATAPNLGSGFIQILDSSRAARCPQGGRWQPGGMAALPQAHPPFVLPNAVQRRA